MSMRSQVYEWDASRGTPMTVANYVGQRVSIFVGGVGNNITKPAETTATEFVVIEDIAPTEREVRISLRDNDDGLTVIADRLKQLAEARYVMVKLGADGVLLHMEAEGNRTITNQLPALNTNPLDVAGAGDSMLIATGLALAAQATPWEAAALGTVAAALQVAKLGNNPIQRDDYIRTLLSFG